MGGGSFQFVLEPTHSVTVMLLSFLVVESSCRWIACYFFESARFSHTHWAVESFSGIDPIDWAAGTKAGRAKNPHSLGLDTLVSRVSLRWIL